MNNPYDQSVMYSETQRARQWWIWLLVAVGVLFVAWMFTEQILLGHPVGNNPAPDGVVWLITILVGIGMPLLAYSVHLTTEIRSDRLVVRLVPVWRRTIMFGDIVNCAPCTYHPILHYGGWGVRYGIGQGMCYTLYGHLGVRVELNNGKRVLIGSQRPEELAAAINRARGRA